jgi:anti-sigma28 factor (negative regulator of flagellin synthesis)
MCVGMALTSGSRLGPRSETDFARAAGTQDTDISRQARIEELRQMVAAGRYQVQPEKLALKILVRALKRR